MTGLIRASIAMSRAGSCLQIGVGGMMVMASLGSRYWWASAHRLHGKVAAQALYLFGAFGLFQARAGVE